MRYKAVLLVVVMLLLSACSIEGQNADDKNNEITRLKQEQDALHKKVELITERVQLLESSLAKKEELIEQLKQDISFVHGNLTEQVLIIREFNLVNAQITTENKMGELKTFYVSPKCKILLPTELHIVENTLEEGIDFIHYAIENKDKVKIVFKSGLVDEIRMHGWDW